MSSVCNDSGSFRHCIFAQSLVYILKVSNNADYVVCVFLSLVFLKVSNNADYVVCVFKSCVFKFWYSFLSLFD